jgi:hypothetical protein
MYPCSDRFLQASAGKIDAVLKARAVVVTGGETFPLRVLAGWSVTQDLDQAVRTRIALSVVDEGGLLPDDPEAIVSPFGPELAFTVGWDYLDGTEELLPYGVFGMYDVTHTAGNVTSLTGFDRARALAEARQEDFYTVTTGVDFAVAIQDLIQDRIPSAEFAFAQTGFSTSGAVLLGGDPDSDPNADAQHLAAAAAHEVFPDRTGTWRLEPIPDPTVGDPLLVYGAGQDRAAQITRAWTRDDWYNAVIITGDRAGATIIQAAAYDTDPESPTYYYGNLKKPWREQSELAFSADQAQAQADALLRQKSRRSERMQVVTLPNPALELGDITGVDSDVARAHSRQVVDAITLSDTAMVVNGNATPKKLVRQLRAGHGGKALKTSHHWGTIVSAGGGLATITLGGATVTNVRYAAGLAPAGGNSCSVRLRGTEPFIDQLV